MKRVIFAILVIAFGSITALAKYSGGTGEPNTPYQIATAADLNDIGNHTEDFNKCFIMTADINMAAYTGTQYKIIGPNSTTPFKGVFDGNRHSIINFNYGNDAQHYAVGIFGIVYDVNAEIRNVLIYEPNVFSYRDSSYVGALAGMIQKGRVVNCYLECGKVSSTSSYETYVGGLIGYLSNGEVNGCSVTITDVNGVYDVGGLIGHSYGVVSECFSDANVTGTVSIGGLIGATESPGQIVNCGSTARVKGGWVGGLVGENYASISRCRAKSQIQGGNCAGGLAGLNYGHIERCWSASAVTGGNSVGGLVGADYWLVTDSYAEGSVSGNRQVGGFIGFFNVGNSGVLNNCFSRGYVSAQISYSCGGFIGEKLGPYDGNNYFLDVAGPNNGAGTPLTDTQMKQQASFVGWDFNDVWAICETTNYPRLIWQIPAADFVCPDGVDFIDYSFFANRWLNTDCAADDDCGGTDFDISGTVDLDDLKIFCNYWLQGV